MSPELIIGLSILAVLTVALGLIYVCYYITFKRKHKGPADPYSGLDHPDYKDYVQGIHAMIDKLLPIPFEWVEIKSHDGLTLKARYYHKVDGAPVLVKVHGYNGCPQRDFCGGGVEELDKHYNVLLIDQRGHEHSEGHCTTFGIMERHDLVGWTNYLVERFGNDVKIVIYGISMGAATVLMASSMATLPTQVVGIIADCGYSSPKEIIIKVATEDMHLPGKLAFPFIRLGARIFGGFDLTETSALEAVKENTRPLLIIHGSGDTFVPHYMSEKIFLAAAPSDDKELMIFEGAGHGVSYMSDRDRYISAMENFLSRTTGYTPKTNG